MNTHKEPPDNDQFWTTVKVGDEDPTTGGMSKEQSACIWNFRPWAPFCCTRERHTDRYHVATQEGRVCAVAIPDGTVTSICTHGYSCTHRYNS